eukprot:TRINITY_DN8213_c0_g2_i3.p1 TRINITY_DN8213_c0_g2~~TRINITY_DN8213_c0_g2_i3.p1  ORF type:complete len:627 (+),score=154.56 TRINITY_DN8213_c0_g2_i3:87-1967(+)
MAVLRSLWFKVGQKCCRSSDSVLDRERKLLLAPAALVVSVYGTLWTAAALAREGPSFVSVFCGVGAAHSAASFLLMLCTDSSASRVAKYLLLMSSVYIGCMDIYGAVQGLHRYWAFETVLIVGSRLLQLESWVPVCIMAVGIAYSFIVVAELAAPFGLREVANLGVDRDVAMCDCADPPCGQGARGVSLVVVVTLVLIDSLAQRFSTNVMMQLRLIEASVEVTQRVTVALGRYEVELAESVVLSPEGEGLPPELRDSLLILLRNLKAYKPYLPQSCLVEDKEEEEDEAEVDVDEMSSLSQVGRRRTSSAGSQRGSRSGSVRSAASGPQLLQQQQQRGTFFGQPRSDPAVKCVSLLCSNRSGFNEFISDSDPPVISRCVTSEVSSFGSAVAAGHGVVDLVNGDHMFASFNAVRLCSRHPHKAVRVQQALDQEEQRAAAGSMRTNALVSGNAVCGNFGSLTIQRFMVVGHLPSLLLVMDRLAAKWGLRVCVNHCAYLDTNLHWQYTVCGACVVHKLGVDKLQRFYEVTGQREVGETQEWMYEVADIETEKGDEMVQVQQWLDALESKVQEQAAQCLRDFFRGSTRVAAVTDVGVEDYCEWKRRGGSLEQRISARHNRADDVRCTSLSS